MATKQSVPAAAAAMLLLSTYAHVVAAQACNSTLEHGMQRSCNYGHDKAPGLVNTTAECAAACCARGPSTPYKQDGCEAWYLDASGNCYFCMGAHKPNLTAFDADPKQCSGDHITECATGRVTPPPPPPLPPAPLTGPLGGEGSVEYVDYGKLLRWPSHINGTAFARDELTAEGWPTMDATLCLFDLRPTGAWAPPMDDPDHRQPDLSGDWTLMIEGQAASISLGDPGMKGVSVGSSTYDAQSNTQTTTVTIAKGSYPDVANLVVLKFEGTQATPVSPNNTGFINLRFIHPDYKDRPEQLFTDNWAALLKTFDHIRWMGDSGTNGYSWKCGGANAAQCSVIQWADRRQPSYAFTDPQLCKGCIGRAWEDILLAANELQSDVWINVPVTASSPTLCQTADGTVDKTIDPRKCIDGSEPGAATDPTKTYEYQLAELFFKGNEYTNYTGLDPKLNIYIEHSNEVWNFGFPQYVLNKALAVWEVLNGTDTIPAGSSNLVKGVPGRPDINCTLQSGNQECWTHRRHARRVYEIGQTFSKVFGASSLNTRIRPVYASWTIDIPEYYNNTLSWLESQYGPVDKYLYAIAGTQYFGPEAQDDYGRSAPFNYSTASMASIVQAFHDGADANKDFTYDFVQFAKAMGVKTAGYESGPGYSVGGEHPGSAGLNNMIHGCRDPGMKDAIVYDVREVCWRLGWDIYNYFAIEGEASRYGCWGAVEDWKNLNPGSPKLQAIYELTGKNPSDLAEWAASDRPRATSAGHMAKMAARQPAHDVLA